MQLQWHYSKKPARRAIAPCLLLLVFAFETMSQSPGDVSSILDAAIDHARSRSLYRDNVNWEREIPEIRLRAKGARSVDELAPALNYLLSRLKDTHGRFLLNGKPIAYYFDEPTENQKKIDLNVWASIQSRSYPFKTEILTGRIGYVRLPGMPMGDNLQMSREIRDAVCQAAKRGATKWIVDLRYNGGGNMYPMMQGIADLIGNGVIGYVVDRNGRKLSTWTIRDSDFCYDEYRAVDLESGCMPAKDPKIAVVISQYTASSGEAVAVAFKGRPNTRFFGLDTAGLVTVTDWTQLGGDLIASISTGYYSDRKSTVYQTYVSPDEKIDFQIGADMNNDEILNTAIRWLRK
ncbi:MAG TPA: S41 family peptidase [Pyrinomonadaceae bacterium]|nr:S41 family peptidase [Pyrinomonadaceae bacterium]